MLVGKPTDRFISVTAYSVTDYMRLRKRLGDARDNTVKLLRCRDKERQALLNFKNEIVDEGGLLSSWGSQEEDCCKWRGIQCSNRTGHVILLNLNGWDNRATGNWVGLSGKVSPSLLELNHLKYLDLSDNDFQSSPILEFIGSLSKLQHLNLSWSGFVGRVPHQLGNLTNLRSLDLGFNDGHLTVENLEWLSDLRLLRHLDLSEIDLEKVDLLQSIDKLSFLSSEIPKSFMNLSRLRSLYLPYNNLTGQLPELFQMLFASKNSLEVLDLYMNKVSGSLPDFTSFSSLRHLALDLNKLNGSFPKHFGLSSPLEYLSLSENDLYGSLPDVASFPLLRQLHLRNNKIQGKLPESIGELSNLKDLDLSFNSLTLEFSSDWIPHFQLETIAFANCKLGPHFPEWLRSQNNFSFLHMSGAGIFGIVPHWFWDLSPRLRYLNISDNQIHGMLPYLSLKYVKLYQIDLGSNHLKGPIPLFPRDLSLLNLSKNMFFGSITSLCTIVTKYLVFLDLSDNLLSSEIPDCWIDANNLEIIEPA
ncbi:hypothetical protein LguiB_027391 [Lonicera macranthoides]